MIPYLTIALAVCALFATAYMQLVRPARKTRQLAAAEPAPEPVPEPRIPRDTSRPYPRPKSSRSKLNRVCPVCGTGPETGSLDGKVLGWPAHASCAEWLGDWKPPRPAPPQYKPDKSLIGSMEQSQRPPAERNVCDVCGVDLGTGVRYHDQAGHHYCPDCDRKGWGCTKFPDGSFPIANAADLARAQEMVKNGLASVSEVRERLNREIIANWAVPAAILEEHTHKAGDPLPIERCPKCGAQFCGTPDYLRSAYKTHLQLGCR